MIPFIWGIDYGSKLAGTTVIASYDGGYIGLASAKKGEDADAFLLAQLLDHPPGKIFLDAPLSLPGVYTQPERYTDHFYRQADRELGAMSPMFLGGLTARAMRLASLLRQQDFQVWETYPAALARLLGLKEKGYKTSQEALVSCTDLLSKHLNISFPTPQHWHQADALLALASGIRQQQGIGQCIGGEEGQIWL
jgi:predicted nuclease with RNAse H fold